MSSVGDTIGSPELGASMLFVLIIIRFASHTASFESGTCTAIWSPSKSALNAVVTSGCSRIALPSMSTGWNAWIPSLCSVGARFSRTGLSCTTRSSMSHTSGLSLSASLFALFMLCA